jgi:hypothetical protein
MESRLSCLSAQRRASHDVFRGLQKRRQDLPSSYEARTFTQFLTLPSISRDYRLANRAIVRKASGRAMSLEGYLPEAIHKRDDDLDLHLRNAPQP